MFIQELPDSADEQPGKGGKADLALVRRQDHGGDRQQGAAACMGRGRGGGDASGSGGHGRDDDDDEKAGRDQGLA